MMKHFSLLCCMAMVATAATAQTTGTLDIENGQGLVLFPHENKILTGRYAEQQLWPGSFSWKWTGYYRQYDMGDISSIYIKPEVDADHTSYLPLNILQYTDNFQAGNISLYTWAAFCGSNPSATDYMNGLYFYAITGIKGQHLSFLIPTDEAFTFVPNVLTFAARNPTVLNLSYNTKSASGNPILYEAWNYDILADERIGENRLPSASFSMSDLAGVMARILCQHTVIGDLNSGNEFFKTLDGTVVRYKDGALQSSREMQLEREGIAGRKAKVVERKDRGNSHFYVVDRVLTQTNLSAWATLRADERCSGFMELCDELNDDLAEQSWPDDLSSTEEKALTEYSAIFLEKHSTLDFVVSMFANADFTLFVPSNEAIAAERAAGRLSTFEQKRDFVLYHFCYGSEYADRLPFAARKHATALVLGTARGVNPSLTVSSAGSGTLSVTDATGRTVNVLPDGKNIFTYDFIVMDDRNSEANIQNVTLSNLGNKRIGSQAPGVIHLIDGVLRHTK